MLLCCYYYYKAALLYLSGKTWPWGYKNIFHAQLCLARKNLQLLAIWDLLAGQISCTAELSMKKSFITSGPIWCYIQTKKMHSSFRYRFTLNSHPYWNSLEFENIHLTTCIQKMLAEFDSHLHCSLRPFCSVIYSKNGILEPLYKKVSYKTFGYKIRELSLLAGGGRVVRRCCVSYITGVSNWYWLTVGQGLLSL